MHLLLITATFGFAWFCGVLDNRTRFRPVQLALTGIVFLLILLAQVIER